MAYARYSVQDSIGALWIGLIAFQVALIVSSSIKIADQWGKAVALRSRRCHSLRGGWNEGNNHGTE